MKFIHTTDWQIGMKTNCIGKVAQIVCNERPTPGKRLIGAAIREGAEFVLDHGDLFEDNAIDRILIQKNR